MITWATDLTADEWDSQLADMHGHPLQSAMWGDTRRAVDGFEDQRPARADLGAPVVIENGGGSLEEALDRLQPVFVASWGSTVLVEALDRGVIPITVVPRHGRRVEATLYPLLRCCLRWLVDKDLIQQVFENPVLYERTVERLQQNECAA